MSFNFSTPINSPKLLHSKGGEKRVQEAKALHKFSLTITSLHFELFWEKDSEHLQSRLPVSENLHPMKFMYQIATISSLHEARRCQWRLDALHFCFISISLLLTYVLLMTFERMVYFLNMSLIDDYLPSISILNTLHHVVWMLNELDVRS